jgi:hypothetical protein
LDTQSCAFTGKYDPFSRGLAPIQSVQMSGKYAGTGPTGGVTGSPTTLPQILWTSPEENLWVANHNGEYAGMVEFVDGHFVSRDNTGHLLGTEVSVRAAKLLVQNHREAKTGLIDAVQNTLHRVGGTLAATMPKRTPHYSRSV